MGIPCAVCTHMQREQIEDAIRSEEIYPSIGIRFNLSKGKIRHHALQHMGIVRTRGGSSRCLACKHPEREKIRQEILDGASIKATGHKYGLLSSNFNEHVRNHWGIFRGRPRCGVCSHESVDAINALIHSPEPGISVARRFGIGHGVLYYHRKNCLNMDQSEDHNRCLSCIHPQRPNIDKELAAGEPSRRVALRYGLSEGSVRRHFHLHLKRTLQAGQGELQQKQMRATAKHAQFKPRGIALAPLSRTSAPPVVEQDFATRLRAEKDAEVAAAEELVRERGKVRAATLAADREAQRELGKAEALLARVHRERNELIVRIAQAQEVA